MLDEYCKFKDEPKKASNLMNKKIWELNIAIADKLLKVRMNDVHENDNKCRFVSVKNYLFLMLSQRVKLKII